MCLQSRCGRETEELTVETSTSHVMKKVRVVLKPQEICEIDYAGSDPVTVTVNRRRKYRWLLAVMIGYLSLLIMSFCWVFKDSLETAYLGLGWLFPLGLGCFFVIIWITIIGLVALRPSTWRMAWERWVWWALFVAGAFSIATTALLFCNPW